MCPFCIYNHNDVMIIMVLEGMNVVCDWFDLWPFRRGNVLYTLEVEEQA